MFRFLRACSAGIVALLTRQPRYLPDIIWSDKSYTHNVFRFYELLFGRRFGIRAESASGITMVDGQPVEWHEAYTLEAYCAYFETWLRKLLTPKRLRIVRLSFARNPYSAVIPMFSFAIALDTATTGTASATSPITWSHTATGSNVLMAICTGVFRAASTQPATSAVSYNSVAATQARKDQFSSASPGSLESSVWLLGSASTGANTVSVTWTNSGTLDGTSITYSGAQSGSTADAVNGTTNTTSGSINTTVAVTTVASNCWIVGSCVREASNSPTITPDQTARGSTATITTSGRFEAEDTNGAVGAGSNTVGFTVGGTTTAATGVSFASFAPDVAATTSHFLALMGLGQ